MLGELYAESVPRYIVINIPGYRPSYLSTVNAAARKRMCKTLIAYTFVRQFFIALLYPGKYNKFLKGVFKMENVFGKLLEVNTIGWILLGVIIISSVIGFILEKRRDSKTSSVLTTKKLVYGGMCVALAFILSYIRLYKMPQGGSITLVSMFPIILYAMVFGPVAGIIAGVANGFLQLIQDPWLVNWAQAFLDYPLAFGFLGLAGLAPRFIKNTQVRTVMAVSIAVLGRGLMHFLSGFIFFAEYAPEGQSPIAYSLIYNSSYIIPELIITLILSLILVATPIYATLKQSSFK